MVPATMTAMDGDVRDYVYDARDWTVRDANAWRYHPDGLGMRWARPPYVARVQDHDGAFWYEASMETPKAVRKPVLSLARSVSACEAKALCEYWQPRYRTMVVAGNCFPMFRMAARWAVFMGSRFDYGLTLIDRQRMPADDLRAMDVFLFCDDAEAATIVAAGMEQPVPW